MSIAQVQVWNMALDVLKAQRVVSLNEQSVPAKILRGMWPFAFGYVLERCNWGHARARVALTELLANDRDALWLGAFQMPTDMALPIRLLENPDAPGQAFLQVGQLPAIYGGLEDDPGQPYDYAGTTLYTDTPTPILEYVRNTAGVDLGSVTFSLAVAYRLAGMSCYGITGSDARAPKLLAEAEVYEDRAKAMNSQSKPSTYGDYVPAVVQARMGYDPTMPWPLSRFR